MIMEGRVSQQEWDSDHRDLESWGPRVLGTQITGDPDRRDLELQAPTLVNCTSCPWLCVAFFAILGFASHR